MRLSLPASLVPPVWTLVQKVLGAPEFKSELYRSRLTPPGKLLDFGCASGHLSDAFSAFEYYGVDLDPVAIRAAERRFPGRPHMKFLAADLRSRPFPRDFFDEIIFAGTAHHLADELLESLLAEMHYCLKPGGKVHLIDPVFQEKDGWTQKLMRRIDRGRYTRTFEEIRAIIERVRLFQAGEPSFHRPYGAILQDCDFLCLPLTKG
jgi:SAM-dependent methyltransferase